MVEFLVKRAIVITLLALAISYGLTPLENRLRHKSDAIFMHGMLEHRVFFTVNDIYSVLDDLDLHHLWHYFLYQFADAVRGLTTTLCFVDLLTLGLRHVPSVAPLDHVPLLYFFFNIAENVSLSALMIWWPAKLVNVAKIVIVCSLFNSLLFGVICILLGLSFAILLYRRKIEKDPEPLDAEAPERMKKAE